NAIVNRGTMSALSGEVIVSSGLTNGGKVLADGGTVLLNGNVANSGEMVAEGGSLMFAAAMTNSGTVNATRGATLSLRNGAVTQTVNAQLIASGANTTFLLRSGASVSGGAIEVSGGAQAAAIGQVTLDRTTLTIGANSEVSISRGTTLTLTNATVDAKDN